MSRSDDDTALLSAGMTERIALVLLAAPVIGALMLVLGADGRPSGRAAVEAVPTVERVMAARMVQDPAPAPAPTQTIVAREVTGFPLAAVIAGTAPAVAPPLPAERTTGAFLMRTGEVVETPPPPTATAAPEAPRLDAAPGDVRVVDPRTLRQGDRVIRLADLAEIAPGTTCRALDGRAQDCAERIAAQLALFLDGRALVCRPAGEAHLCRVGSTDVGDWLARRGLARPEGARYAQAAAFARRHGLGLWGADRVAGR